MSFDFQEAEKIIAAAFPSVPAAQLCIRRGDEVIYSQAFGLLDLESRTHPTTTNTRFDIASVSKLFTTTAFMALVERSVISLDTPVYTVLPEFTGLRPIAMYEDPLEEGAFLDVSSGSSEPVDAGRVTFRHLLTHTSGLPAWRPLYLLASEIAAKWTVLTSFFSYQTGARVVYSDLGLILVGMALERLVGERLDTVIEELVTKPLGLAHTGYLPVGTRLSEDAEIAPTEICRWRKRRLLGEVDDENCGRFGGISGHAGLFSTAEDVASLGQSYLTPGRLLSAETVLEMTKLQAGVGTSSPRGIGFELWAQDPESNAFPFSPKSFGHGGFTGTSLWMDPERDLAVALLANEVYHGRYNRVIDPFRISVHRAVVPAVDVG